MSGKEEETVNLWESSVTSHDTHNTSLTVTSGVGSSRHGGAFEWTR